MEKMHLQGIGQMATLEYATLSDLMVGAVILKETWFCREPGLMPFMALKPITSTLSCTWKELKANAACTTAM